MLWIVIWLCLGVVKCQEAIQTNDKLIFAQVIFRHGDRTIRNPYPNDPYKDISHWPDGFGQLTNLGKRHQYELGKFLHKRYAKFLGSYSPDKITVLSSNYDRTINSANLVLAALFPPKDNQIWNEDLLWQPIAVHSLPKEIDYFIQAEIACPRYVEIRKQYEQSELKALKQQYQELFEYLEQKTGQPVRTLANLKDIYETLDTEHSLNKTLPEWTHEIYYPGGDFERLAHRWLIFITGTTEMKKLKSGFILKEIFDRFKNKTLSFLPDQLMQIYSGHDITVASILNTLGVFDQRVPPYSSGILFELYESDDRHYVQVLYKNSTANSLIQLNIPNCGTKCTLNILYELYSDILPSDFETECKK